MSGSLYVLMMVWAVLQALWPASPSASWRSSCGQWRLLVLRLLLFCLFFVASVLSMLEMPNTWQQKLVCTHYFRDLLRWPWKENYTVHRFLICCISCQSACVDVGSVILSFLSDQMIFGYLSNECSKDSIFKKFQSFKIPKSIIHTN
jgi:hypothetical protein